MYTSWINSRIPTVLFFLPIQLTRPLSSGLTQNFDISRVSDNICIGQLGEELDSRLRIPILGSPQPRQHSAGSTIIYPIVVLALFLNLIFLNVIYCIVKFKFLQELLNGLNKYASQNFLVAYPLIKF
jgi:hypothetical protein